MASTRCLPPSLIAIALAAAVHVASAQGVPNREAAIAIRQQYIVDLDSLRSKFMALAEAFPADKYSWRPAPNVRSVGEVLMHAASEYYTYAPAVYGAPASPVITRTAEGFKAFEAKASKPEALKHLREGFAFARQSLDALDPEVLVGPHMIFGGKHTVIEMSFDVTDDLHEHLGQLIAYARMNGVVPPWSK